MESWDSLFPHHQWILLGPGQSSFSDILVEDAQSFKTEILPELDQQNVNATYIDQSIEEIIAYVDTAKELSNQSNYYDAVISLDKGSKLFSKIVDESIGEG